jgi:hypothetical protein
VAGRRRRGRRTAILAIGTTNRLPNRQLFISHNRAELGRVIGTLTIDSVQKAVDIIAELLGGADLGERGSKSVG